VHSHDGGPARIGPDAEGPSVGDDLDVAVQVGAEDGGAGELGQGLGCRVAVLVVLADRHGGDRRIDYSQKARRRRRV
jgi:hypothetical protein